MFIGFVADYIRKLAPASILPGDAIIIIIAVVSPQMKMLYSTRIELY